MTPWNARLPKPLPEQRWPVPEDEETLERHSSCNHVAVDTLKKLWCTSSSPANMTIRLIFWILRSLRVGWGSIRPMGYTKSCQNAWNRISCQNMSWKHVGVSENVDPASDHWKLRLLEVKNGCLNPFTAGRAWYGPVLYGVIPTSVLHISPPQCPWEWSPPASNQNLSRAQGHFSSPN